MKYKDFTDYLREKHANGYGGLDDDMCDDCDEWISALDVQELIDYADLCAAELLNLK